jgi:hypothetical protein
MTVQCKVKTNIYILSTFTLQISKFKNMSIPSIFDLISLTKWSNAFLVYIDQCNTIQCLFLLHNLNTTWVGGVI